MAVTLDFEQALGGTVIGVDEAGRGPLAGGVFAAAVSVPLRVIRVVPHAHADMGEALVGQDPEQILLFPVEIIVFDAAGLFRDDGGDVHPQNEILRQLRDRLDVERIADDRGRSGFFRLLLRAFLRGFPCRIPLDRTAAGAEQQQNPDRFLHRCLPIYGSRSSVCASSCAVPSSRCLDFAPKNR